MANKLRYFALYKPYGYISQFTDPHGKSGLLGELYHFPPDAYAVGRLDKDSEGLLLLTNDKTINHRLLHPSNKHHRSYWVQVERDITPDALAKLEKGVTITYSNKPFTTAPAKARKLSDEAIWLPERHPPPRIKHGSSWIALTLTEGKFRQVRKMTAAVGHPTLRLVRVSIENLVLDGMAPGEVKEYNRDEMLRLLKL